MRKIKIGDRVLYKPWSEPDQTAIVQSIEICRPGEKYGRSVSSCNIDAYLNGVVELSNGHWCYFYQIKQVIEKGDNYGKDK